MICQITFLFAKLVVLLMFTFNKDVVCLIQNKDWYMAQRFMLRAKIYMKTHTKINVWAQIVLSKEKIHTQSEPDLYSMSKKFTLETDNWYSEYESFDQTMNRLSEKKIHTGSDPDSTLYPLHKQHGSISQSTWLLLRCFVSNSDTRLLLANHKDSFSEHRSVWRVILHELIKSIFSLLFSLGG